MDLSMQERLQDAFAGTTLMRSRDLTARGVNRVWLGNAVQAGLLERVGRGLYRLPGADITEDHTLAEVGKRVPNGIICLLSALNMHRLTAQNPHEVWLAIRQGSWSPRTGGVGLRIVRLSGQALDEGIDSRTVEGVSVRVYNPAKTVADCFKFRHKIGIDVALEALRESWRARMVTMQDLEHYARIDRVSRVMRPYLESLA